MSNNEHHEALITLACQDGWIRGHAWQSKIRQIGRARRYGEIKVLEEHFTDDLPRPDAWRVLLEDSDTPDQSWNYPVVVLEFL